MKQLFYQIDYFEREDEPREVVSIMVNDADADEIKEVLKTVFNKGYDLDEIESRDDWVDATLEDIVVFQFGGTWEYVQMDGVLFVE